MVCVYLSYSGFKVRVKVVKWGVSLIQLKGQEFYWQRLVLLWVQNSKGWGGWLLEMRRDGFVFGVAFISHTLYGLMFCCPTLSLKNRLFPSWTTKPLRNTLSRTTQPLTSLLLPCILQVNTLHPHSLKRIQKRKRPCIVNFLLLECVILWSWGFLTSSQFNPDWKLCIIFKDLPQ